MTDTGTSLRPYGQALAINTRLGLQFGDPHREPAIARASAKLAAPCADPPLGIAKAATFVRVGMAAQIAGGSLALTFTFERAAPAIYPGVLCALVLCLYSLYVVVTGRPKDPYSAVREWLRCLQNHEWGRAHRLVAACDRDSWQRCPPSQNPANVGLERAEAFGEIAGFRRYWSRTLIQGAGTRIRLRMSPKALAVEILPDLWAVTVEMRIEPAVRLGNLPWQSFTKLALRCGDEWRVFSGELWAPEEADLSWLAGAEAQE